MAWWYSWQDGKTYQSHKDYIRSITKYGVSSNSTVVSRTTYIGGKNYFSLYRKPEPEDKNIYRNTTVTYHYNGLIIKIDYTPKSALIPRSRRFKKAYAGQLPSEYVKVASHPYRTPNGIITRTFKKGNV